MSNNTRWEPELILEIVRLTDCYALDEVRVTATDEQIANICERYNMPRWLYDQLIAWAGHGFGGLGCLADLKRRYDDESTSMAERALAWLAACKYAREHDETVVRPE